VEELLLAQDYLMPEIEAEAAVADPADEAVDPGAMFELDDDRLADTRQYVAFDHCPARGDVEDGNEMVLAAEGDDGAIDDVAEPLLGPLIDKPVLGALDDVPDKAHIPFLQAHPHHSARNEAIMARKGLPNS
jgi:hypothetical protein